MPPSFPLGVAESTRLGLRPAPATCDPRLVFLAPVPALAERALQPLLASALGLWLIGMQV